jgi:hypothetical protein
MVFLIKYWNYGKGQLQKKGDENMRIVTSVSRRRLKNMLRWFKNKGQEVKISYIYNNSRGQHEERSYIGIIKSFTVEKDEEYGEFKISVLFTDDSSMKECLDSWWEFYDLGKLRMCNSGPYCYFSIWFTERNKEKSNGA